MKRKILFAIMRNVGYIGIYTLIEAVMICVVSTSDDPFSIPFLVICTFIFIVFVYNNVKEIVNSSSKLKQFNNFIKTINNENDENSLPEPADVHFDEWIDLSEK